MAVTVKISQEKIIENILGVKMASLLPKIKDFDLLVL